MEPLTGTTVGPYGIGPLIGSGGMAEVYRAHDSRLDRDVALKVLSADDSTAAVSIGRFQKEAKTIASLTDPHWDPDPGGDRPMKRSAWLIHVAVLLPLPVVAQGREPELS